MAKKGEARELVTLKCSVCKSENYRVSKNKKKYYWPFRIK